MSKIEKLIAKLKQAESTYPWRDLVTLLARIGYTKQEMAGSRVRFSKQSSLILLHKPHPENEIKVGALKSIKDMLQREGLL